MKFAKGARVAPFFIGKDSRGFTLVELMIVVAIIGLLSAVAIPNFRQFQSRSRTTEAKLQLSAIYTAEASFYSSYQIYHNCLLGMGYDPIEFRPTRFYAVGFTNAAAINAIAYATAINLDLKSSSCPQNLAATLDSTFFEAGTGVGAAVATSAHIPATALGDQASDATMTFTAGAGGVINKNYTAATAASAFTINQLKQILTVRNGF